MSSKREKIKATLQATRERHAALVCKVFRLKLDYSRLSKAKLAYLNRLFLEKKWYRNFIIGQGDIFNASDKLKTVTIKKGEAFEEREIKVLSSQMRQSVMSELKENIKALAAVKKLGSKVGALKFTSRCDTIELKQCGVTYRVKGKTFFLQGFKKSFKLEGIRQIPAGAEFANARLVRKPSGFYLHITVFVEKAAREHTGKAIGLDFGIKDNIVDSNGECHNWSFPETRRMKRVSRKLNRAYARKKGGKKSGNDRKRQAVLALEYERLGNRKRDARNKFIAELVRENDLIAVQDESIAQWKSCKRRGWGNRVHHSIMGGIMSGLKRKPQTLVVRKGFVSTQLCPCCRRKKQDSA
jgi:transposase